ncbi:hypothetical protein ABZU94_39320 [Streptomyces mirabilis]|uniref:hypothetical protein n=1 Tax=Streptomyces sp. NPDC005388 TaxID=3156717 RepID=UPI0033ABB02E
MDFTGPLDIKAPTDYAELIKSTPPERGHAHLAYALRWVGEDGSKMDGEGNVTPGWAATPDGWETFNATYAPELAGEICADLLSYVWEATGAEGLGLSLRTLLASLAGEEVAGDADVQHSLRTLLDSLADALD